MQDTGSNDKIENVKSLPMRWQASEWAVKYNGIPYKEKGRDFGGLDCWGLVWMAYMTEAGVNVGRFDELEYEGTSSNKEEIQATIREQAAKNGWIKIAETSPILGRPGYKALSWFRKPQALDVVLVAMGSYVTHVGLMCSKVHMLHILQGTEVTIEDMTKPTWERRVNSVYRYAALC